MSAALSDLDRFKLAPPPASPRAALEQTIRARRAERDRVARRDPAYEAVRARAFICMAGEELIGVHDPVEDGATLPAVLEHLAGCWRGEFVVWRGGRLVATARVERGLYVITILE